MIWYALDIGKRHGLLGLKILDRAELFLQKMIFGEAVKRLLSHIIQGPVELFGIHLRLQQNALGLVGSASGVSVDFDSTMLSTGDFRMNGTVT